jgi:hypothetical protein
LVYLWLAWYHHHHHFRCWAIKCCPQKKMIDVGQSNVVPKKKWASKISAMGTSDKTTQIWGHIAPPPPTPITKSNLKTCAKLKNMLTHLNFACSLVIGMCLLHACNPARFNFLLKRGPTIPFPKLCNGLFFTCYTCEQPHHEPAPTSTPSVGCPLLLSCGWISSESKFGFTLVTNSVGNRSHI